MKRDIIKVADSCIDLNEVQYFFKNFSYERRFIFFKKKNSDIVIMFKNKKSLIISFDSEVDRNIVYYDLSTEYLKKTYNNMSVIQT